MMFSRKIQGVLFAALLWVAAGLSSWAQNANGAGSVVRLNKFTADRGPGIAFIVMKSGKKIDEGYFGFQNREQNGKATAKTRFNLASNSKQFTATAILILEEKGLLGLDDKVTKYISEWPDYAKDISIRHLLFHTGGLQDYMPICTTGSNVDNAAVIKFLATEKALVFPAGTKHEYSNTGYVVLSEIVQRVSKRSFDKFVSDEIFVPLGMKQSFVLTTENSSKIPEKAVPYDEWPFFDVIDRHTCDFIFGDGGIFVTAGDYGIWLDAVASGKLSVLKKPTRLFDAGATDDGKALDYGYGWQIDNLDGVKMIAHSGLWGGNKSFAAIFPDEKLSVAVISNYRVAPVWRITEELAKKYLPASKGAGSK